MENTYAANPKNLFIPSKTLKILPDAANVTIRAQGEGTSQMVFSLPSYLNFISPESLRMRFSLKFSGRGQPKPNPVAAASSLFRHMRVSTMDGMNVCEEVDDYHSSVAMGYSYTGDDGMNADRELNEGLSLTNNPANQLFWTAPNVPEDGVTTANVAKNVAISLPLNSGLLGPTAPVLPIGALGGINVRFEMATIKKSVKLTSDVSKGGPKAVEVATEVTAAAWTGDLNKIVNILATEKSDQQAGFEIGDSIYYDKAGTDTLIGLVCGLTDGAGNTQIAVRGNVGNTPATGQLLPVGTKLFTKNTDRYNGWTPGTNMQGTGATIPAAISLANAVAPVKVNYEINDLEMIVEQLQPPESYVNGLVQKLNSKEGLVMNYKNTTLHRVNLVAVKGNIQATIPNTARRVYAINAMPLNSSDTFNGDNLTCTSPDFAQQYQWSINSVLQPDQRVPLRRLSLTPAYVEQLALQETFKSLASSGLFVRNLQNAEKNFQISRSVSMFGGVSDITKSDLSLRIEYSDDAVRQKTLNTYICTARTLVIRANEVSVIM